MGIEVVDLHVAVEDLQTPALEKDLDMVQNFLWHGVSGDAREAFDRIQSVLAEAQAENVRLAGQLRKLTDSTSVQRMNWVEDQLTQARDLAERSAACLRSITT